MSLKSVKAHCILVFAVCLMFTGQAQAILIGFDSPTNNVTLGSSVDVDLVISGLGDFAPPSLGAFDLDITYDSAIVDLAGVAFGTQLDLLGFGSIRGVSEVNGTVSLFEISLDFPFDLDTLQPGAFTLATLTFDAIAAGTSSLVTSNEILSDSLGSPLFADTGTGSITVRGVPEPATLALLSLGLAGLGFTRRRIKA